MEFTLQKLVQQTLAEAEHRVKVAQAAEESEEEKQEGSPAKKKAPSDNPSTAPERNEEGISEKTATVFVEKLAAAVQYLNENYLEKEAVGKPEPPTAHTPPQADKGLGAGKGTGAMATNLESPTSGMQSEETGQAQKDQIPLTTGGDVSSPGQTNPSTAMETDMNDRPGGSEDWTNQDKMKQAGAREKLLGLAGKAKNFAAGRAGAARDAAQHLKGAVSKGNTLKERAVQVGRAVKKSPELAAAAGLGTAGVTALGVRGAKRIKEDPSKAAYGLLGAGLTSKKGSKEKKAQVARILDIMNKMAADPSSPPASIGAKVTNPHQSLPEGASQAEEAVPSQPGEVSKQESMVGSNESATNYTKQQAKAVPKARMGEVLNEPAQKKSSDPVLQNNLDAASSAGVKIASASAARALLEKIAEEGASGDATPEQKERASKLQELLQAKQKESQMGTPEPSMPVGGGY
jgi:hypothetical protein